MDEDDHVASAAPRNKCRVIPSNGEDHVSFSVNTNTNALAALETLSHTQQSLTKTQNRVSSGLKVAGAADDASTFAIAQGQRGDIAGFQAISNSLALGSAFVNVALNGAQSISDTLNQIKAKVVQAQDPTQDHNAIQNDITAFLQQINGVAAAAQFNGVNLINAGSASQNVLSSLNRTGSTVSTATITVNAQDLTAAGLGVNGLNVASATGTLTIGSSYAPATGQTLTLTSGGVTSTFEFVTSLATSLTAAGNVAVVIGGTTGQSTANLTTALGKNGYNASFTPTGNLLVSSGAGDITADTSTVTGLVGTIGAASSAGALTTVENAINKIKTSLSQLGTAANQISTQTNFVKSLTDSLTGGVSQLVDADLAAESANLQSLQTKQQLGIQALSIANQGPGAVLTLFR
jgi:flagellin